METVIDCPLGAQCEYIGDDKKLHRCAWYIELEGKNPQSEEYVKDWGCALAWLPMLTVQVAQTNRGQTSAICSFRDNFIKGVQQLNENVSKSIELRNYNTNNVIDI